MTSPCPNHKHLPTLHFTFDFSSSFIFFFRKNIFVTNVMLLQLLASNCDIVVALPLLRCCVALLEEGNLCASTFYHHTYGYNAMLPCYRRKRPKHVACCCNMTLCCYRRKETCVPSMFLQHGTFGVLLHLIEGYLHAFIVVMRHYVEGDCWTNNNPPC